MNEYKNPMHAMADHLIDFFEGEGAVNYIEQTFGCNDDPSKSFVITMQKVDGLTPCQKLDQANKRVEDLESKLRELCSVSESVFSDDIVNWVENNVDEIKQLLDDK